MGGRRVVHLNPLPRYNLRAGVGKNVVTHKGIRSSCTKGNICALAKTSSLYYFLFLLQ